MAEVLARLGGRLVRIDSKELTTIDDTQVHARADRPPFLIRLGFAAWCDDLGELVDDPLFFDGTELASNAAPPTTAETQSLLNMLLVVRRQGTLYLLDGIDAGRHLMPVNDARSRRLNARSTQSPFLVGLSFAAVVADTDLLRNPTDAGMAEL
jgi:hypothetical protein